MDGPWRRRRNPVVLYFPLLHPQLLLVKSYLGGRIKHLSMPNTFAVKMQTLYHLVVRKVISFYSITKVLDKQNLVRTGPVAGIPDNLKTYFSHRESFQPLVMLHAPPQPPLHPPRSAQGCHPAKLLHLPRASSAQPPNGSRSRQGQQPHCVMSKDADFRDH